MSLTIFCRWWWFMCGVKTHLTIFIIFIRRFYVQYSTVHLIGSTVRVITNAEAWVTMVITFHTLSQNNQNPHMKTQPLTAIYCTMYKYHPPPPPLSGTGSVFMQRIQIICLGAGQSCTWAIPILPVQHIMKYCLWWFVDIRGKYIIYIYIYLAHCRESWN